jgi:hypothetical protein
MIGREEIMLGNGQKGIAGFLRLPTTSVVNLRKLRLVVPNTTLQPGPLEVVEK